MAKITTQDRLANQLVAAATQYCYVNKLAPATGVAHEWFDMWAGAGQPGAGGFGATGKANGRVCTRATTGALVYPGNAAGGNTLHLLASLLAPCTSGSTAFELVIVDRISDVTLAYNEANGSITGVDATSRLPAGAGAQLIVNAATALAASSNVVQFGYTNTDGTASRSTGQITCTASAAVGRSVNGRLYQPLQANDVGIRTLDSFTLVSGAGATGTICAALVRPLAVISAETLILPQIREFIFNTPSQARIMDDSCIDLLLLPSTAVQNRVTGSIWLVEG